MCVCAVCCGLAEGTHTQVPQRDRAGGQERAARSTVQGSVQQAVDLQPPHLQQEQEEEHSGVGKGAGPVRLQHAGEAGDGVCGGPATCH